MDMQLTAAGKTYDFKLDNLSNVDVMDLEELVGMTLAEWGGRLAKGEAPSAKEMTVLVWLARRQNGEPDLAFKDVRFPVGSFNVLTDEDTPDPGNPTDGSPPKPAEPSDVNDSPAAASTI